MAHGHAGDPGKTCVTTAARMNVHDKSTSVVFVSSLCRQSHIGFFPCRCSQSCSSAMLFFPRLGTRRSARLLAESKFSEVSSFAVSGDWCLRDAGRERSNILAGSVLPCPKQSVLAEGASTLAYVYNCGSGDFLTSTSREGNKSPASHHETWQSGTHDRARNRNRNTGPGGKAG
jgi:hypothetical protein